MFQLNSMRSFEECATTTLHLLSVPRICEHPAKKITLLPTCTSELCFFSRIGVSRSRAHLMSQNTHLSLRPIQTIYLCQSVTGISLIKISDVLTLCRSNFKILLGALAIQDSHALPVLSSHSHLTPLPSGAPSVAV